ncbi:NADH dehydrogenase (ubiquinone) B14 subunit isoform X2 [Temnothorax americanus]|uniref:NADH dehydrogenase (ubiquinone) B14 subunit isoform X2 n=1 Tax=Temnothorax americanus TaxID=1964332 RepID=UPI004067A3F1
MASRAATVVRQVKPILSINREDARRKVLTLYKAWIRQVPSSLLSYDIPKTEAECKRKIREEFKRHAHLTDLRIIDKQIIREVGCRHVAGRWQSREKVFSSCEN